MGDRVAVMRKGELQQVAPPEELYHRPLNVFVGGFIGSPAMNMLEATVERTNGGVEVVAGDARIGLDEQTLAEHPELRGVRGSPDRPRDPAGEPRGRGARLRTAAARGCAGAPSSARRSARRCSSTSRSRRGRRRPRTSASSPRTSATTARSSSSPASAPTSRRSSSAGSTPQTAIREGDAIESPSTRARSTSSTPQPATRSPSAPGCLVQPRRLGRRQELLEPLSGDREVHQVGGGGPVGITGEQRVVDRAVARPRRLEGALGDKRPATCAPAACRWRGSGSARRAWHFRRRRE